ncbi:hypothetical protein [Kordia sp.]|uniref:hypothetical protein n=1 Tax=Kordia sp. TaxID=1965332 RepID=UPI003D2A7053
MNIKQLTILFLIVILTFSCKNKYDLSVSEIEFLIKETDEMHEIDQGIRHKLIDLDVYYGVDRKSYGSFLSFKDKKEILGKEYAEYRRKGDSLREVMHSIDEVNTQKLLALTKQYGFPGKERLGTYHASAYFIFVHSARKYFDEIRTLINQEYEAKRISEYERAYIFWHLDGRNGMMPSVNEDGSVNY